MEQYLSKFGDHTVLCELVRRNSTGQLFLSYTRGLVFVIMESQLELVLVFASAFVSES